MPKVTPQQGRMQDRFEALCQRIEMGFEGIPEVVGLQEIDAAVAVERAAHRASPQTR